MSLPDAGCFGIIGLRSMVFSSHIFLFWFLPLALLGYYALVRRTRLRNLWLTVISYLFLVSGVPGSRVVVADDMLFARERVEPRSAAYWRERDSTVRDLVAPLVQRFRDLGIELLVAPVPESVRIYPEKLPGWREGANAAAYAAMLETLRGCGAHVLDLAAELRRARRTRPEERLFRRDDHHWTHHASLVAAGAIARRITALCGLRRAGLGLVKERFAADGRGSYLIMAGWPQGCEAWNRFAEPSLKYRVLDRMGKPYVAPIDGEVIMVCDSFGGFHTAALVAAHADCPVGDLWVAGRGAVYPMAELLQLVSEGLRPRCVIWLFEEAATFRERAPWKGLILAETVPDIASGAWEEPVSLAVLRSDSEVGVEGRDGELVVASPLEGFDLRLPAPPADATHLIVELRGPVGAGARARTTLGIADGDGDDPPTRRALVFDRFRDRWQRTCLPLEGRQGRRLRLVLETALGGKRFHFRRFAWLRSPWPEAPPRDLAWRPEGVRLAASAPAGGFLAPGEPLPLRPTIVNGRSRLLVATAVPQRFLLEPALPGGGRLRLEVLLDGRRVERSGSVVFRFELCGPGAGRSVFWSEMQATPGQERSVSLTLPLPGDAERQHLMIDVRPAASCAGRVGVGVVFLH